MFRRKFTSPATARQDSNDDSDSAATKKQKSGPTRKPMLFLSVAILMALSCTSMLLAPVDFTASIIGTSKDANTGSSPSTNKISDAVLASQSQKKVRQPPPLLPEEERFTSHFCHSRDLLNDSGQRSSCMFHHLCVIQAPPESSSKQEVQWLYVVEEQVNDQQTKKLVNTKETTFSLGVGPHSGDIRVNFEPVPITMGELDSKYPQRAFVEGPSVVYYEYNSENFGHMLTDVLMPIFAVLESFGLAQESVNVFRYSIMDAIGWNCDFQNGNSPEALERNPRGVAKKCDRLQNMMPKLMPVPHRPIQVLNGTTVVPTCFETVVVGMPMYSDDCLEGTHGREQNSWQLCNHGKQGQFWAFRNYVLSNVGVDTAPPPRHKITIAKRSDGGRFLKNLGDLQSLIKKMYPDIEVVEVEWEKLSLWDQFDLIRTTTLHLTPPGGISYISIFLPRWATSIRLYSSDFKTDWHLFHYLGYMTVEHVDCQRNETIPLEETMELVAKSLERYDMFRIGEGDSSWKRHSRIKKVHNKTSGSAAVGRP